MNAAPVSTTTRFARSPWRMTLVARSIASSAVPCAVARRFKINSSTIGFPTLGYFTTLDNRNASGSARSFAEAIEAAGDALVGVSEAQASAAAHTSSLCQWASRAATPSAGLRAEWPPGGLSAMTGPKKIHWDTVYGSKPLTEVSWYEPRPVLSLQFIRASRLQSNEPIIDVGGGGSFLAEELLGAGYKDLTVLDISSEVLKSLGERVGERARQVTLLQQDVTDFRPARRYALWHDRAVFHFLIHPEERNGYLRALREALQPGGQVVIGTFGLEGPRQCSGLPVIRYDAMTLAALDGRGQRPRVASPVKTCRD